MQRNRWLLPLAFVLACSSKENKPDEVTPEEIAPPPGQSVPLTKEQAEQVLKRLGPLSQPAASQPDFFLREDSLPPPRPGKTIEQSFPPPVSERPPEVSDVSKPLTVVRYSPMGEVAQAANLSITFSHSMSTLGEEIALKPEQVPVILTPQPEGQWRWLGDKTLIFEHGDELPKATEYKVTIPAGTKSTTGAALEKEVTFSFATPYPVVESFYPYSGSTGSELTPTIGFSFNQDVDPSKIAAALKVSPSVPLELTSGDKPGKNISFKPKTPFNKNTNVTVTLPAGAYSVEGPRPLQRAYVSTFRTYGPLKLVSSTCKYYESKEPCYPENQWSFFFSNSLKEFDQKQIEVTPAVEDFACSGYSEVYCSGKFKGDTKYTIKFSPDVKDVFDQTLGAPATASFSIGAAQQTLRINNSEYFTVLDPAAKPTITVAGTNYTGLKVDLYQVTAADYNTYNNNRYGFIDTEYPVAPPGTLLNTQVIPLTKRNEEVKTEIDLTPYLEDGIGNILVIVVPTDKPRKDEYGYVYRDGATAWIQSTKISLDYFVDQQDMFVFAQELATGAALEGADVSLNGQSPVKTESNGIAKLPRPTYGAYGQDRVIVCKGKDCAFTPDSFYNYGTSSVTEENQWFIFDDRGLYRPGEQVHIKGWVRRNKLGKLGDLLGLSSLQGASYTLRDNRGNDIKKGTVSFNAFGGFDLALDLPDTMNLGYAQLEFSVGGFLFSSPEVRSHSFRVEEFRRPEYEVTAKSSEGIRFAQDKAEVTVNAKYYSGGALPDAPVTWSIRAEEANFTPPNLDEYTFGDNLWKWWHKKELPELSALLAEPPATTPTSASTNPIPLPGEPKKITEGLTGATGEHTVPLRLPGVTPPRPYNIYAQATVQDLNNQSWSANTTILVHPSSYYVGVKTEKSFSQKGQPVVLQMVVSDLDGKLIAGRDVKLSITHIKEEFKEGAWKETRSDEQTSTIKSDSKAAEHVFTPAKGGTYEVIAEVLDQDERKNITSFTLWVAGDDEEEDRSLGADTLQVIPDKKEYKPGDTAEILVASPFSPAEGLLLVNRGGYVSYERFHMDSSTKTLNVKIDEKHYPGVSFEVLVVGAKARRNKAASQDTKIAAQPAYAMGSAAVSVPPVTRTLQLTVTPKKKELAPGEKTEINVIVKDQDGKPLADAEVIAIVVDESVLALSGYQLPNPLDTFYQARYTYNQAQHHRQWVQLAKNDELLPVPPPPPPPPPVADPSPIEQDGKDILETAKLMDVTRAPGGGSSGGLAFAAAPMAEPKADKKHAGDEGRMGKKSESKNKEVTGLYQMKGPIEVDGIIEGPTVSIRTDLNPLALFSTNNVTDKKGRVKIKFTLPDNLTRYRVVVMAADKTTKFGKTEETITATRPLMVRPSAPRFMYIGDHAIVPVLVQNTGDKPLLVKVAMRSQDGAEVEAPGFWANVPANDRVELRFPINAKAAGKNLFQVVAISGKWNDANEFSLPIYTPVTTEAQAVYGVIDEGAISQSMKLPKDVYLEYGGIEVTTSSTALATLSDAVLYLVRYPYECAEQLSSRVLGVAALRDVLTAFDAEGLPPAALMEASVITDLRLLSERQNYDGGFGFWKKGEESWPYLSLHVAHAVARAQQKGYTIPSELLYGVQRYLPSLEYLPLREYSQETKDSLLAYSFYIQHFFGNNYSARAAKMVKDRGIDKLPLESLGWLLVAMSDDATSNQTTINEIVSHLQQQISETADEAHFTTNYGDDFGYLILSSDRRTDAILLEALIKVDPKNTLIPKLVTGLTKHKTAGRWGNTQENVFVLLALDAYFHQYESITPDFVTKIWLGDTYAGEQPFKGRSSDRKKLSLPFSILEKTPETNLIISKEGEGRLYYRIGMRYAPKSLLLDAASYGFTVSRTYEAVDNKDDVQHQQDGTWKIKAGARVRVKLTMIAPTRRYHVALVDPLPAGLEVQNASFANTRDDAGTSGSSSHGKSRYRYWWWYQWFSFENKRDERVEAFSSLLWEGTYTYEYTTLATTPGTFIVPPTKAEEMYSPETFGRSASDKVIIEATPNQL